MVMLLVITEMSRRVESSLAISVLVDPLSKKSVSPGDTSETAFSAILRFSDRLGLPGSSAFCFSVPIAPPVTRFKRPSCSISAKSLRTVAGETPSLLQASSTFKKVYS